MIIVFQLKEERRRGERRKFMVSVMKRPVTERMFVKNFET
jgi:hypothetical protein